MTPDINPPIPSSATSPKPRGGIAWKWTIAVTVVVIGLWVWQCGSALVTGKRLANAAVQDFHDQLNGAQYEQIYEEADEGFRHSGNTQEQMIKFLQAIHNKLGNAGAPKLTNITVQATPGGTFVTTIYRTKFERGDAVERFTWIKRDDHLLLYVYNVESMALIISE